MKLQLRWIFYQKLFYKYPTCYKRNIFIRWWSNK